MWFAVVVSLILLTSLLFWCLLLGSAPDDVPPDYRDVTK